MNNALRSFLAEPRVPDPPARVWRDWALVGVMAASALAEAALRTDVPWRIASLIMCLLVVPTLLWRRTYPLAMTAVAFGSINLFSGVGMFFVSEPLGLYTTAVILVLPYAIFRWASGRHAAFGAVIMLSAWVIGITTDPGTIGDAIGGFTVLEAPAVLGLMIRYRSTVRVREREEIKLREREQLARELHDTVAHHVSAIAVQAQAGRALAATRPDAAVEALDVIEEAASRTLSEMRTMVGALRRGDAADLAPQRGVADIRRLAHSTSGDLPVKVDLSGDLDALSPAIDAALYRIAQESVTNAARHARKATRVDVRVTGLDDRVLVSICDDGDATGVDTNASGYGLLGMAERAKLLGGTFAAGPAGTRGWRISAELPRDGGK